MTFIIVEMLIVGALLVANGVFAMSEMAVVSSRKFQAQANGGRW